MKSLFSLSGVFFSLLLFGQEDIVFRRLAMDGLTSPTVNSIFKDKEGYLWMGTPEGLNRFDGYKYSNYLQGGADSSLSNNHITDIEEDSLGRMWIATRNGLNLYDRSTQTFKRFFFDDLEANNIEALYLDHKKRLWIGTWHGLYLLHSKNLQFKNFNTKSGFGTYKVGKLLMDSQGLLWIGTLFDGLFLYDEKKNIFRNFNANGGNSSKLSSNNITFLYEDSKKQIWIGTYDKGLNRYDASANTFWQYQKTEATNSIASNHVMTIFESTSNQLIVGGMHGGMSMFNAKSDDFYRYDTDGKLKKLGNKATILCHYKSKQDEVFISTSEGGVKILDDMPYGLIHLRNEETTANSLSINAVTDILYIKNHLWIATDGGGLNDYNIKSKAFTRWNENENHLHKFKDNTINEISQYGENILWLATLKNGPVLYHIKENRFDYSLKQHKELQNCKKIFYDGKSTWVATETAIFQIENLNKPPVKFSKNTTGDSPLRQILGFCTDSNGTLWAASDTKLFYYQPQKGFEAVTLSPQTTINHIASSKQGLLISTKDQGILYKKSVESEYISLAFSENMVSKNVNEALIFNDSLLAVATCDALYVCKFISNTAVEIIYEINTYDGIKGALSGSGTICKINDSTLAIGNLEGIYLIPVTNSKPTSITQNIVVTSIKLNGKHINPDQNKNILVDNLESELQIEASFLNFIKSDKNRYAFKLMGYDSSWNYTGHKRVYSYSRLPEGNYVLYIKAANSDNRWVEKKMDFTISCQTPFYKKTGFIVSVGFVFLLLAGGLVLWLYKKYPSSFLSIKENTKKLIGKFSSSGVGVEEQPNIQNVDFIKNTVFTIENALGLYEIDTDWLCKQLGTSRAQLFRRIKTETGLTVGEFIKQVKLQKAKTMLESGSCSVSEAATLAGFKSLSHFSRSFQAEFGLSPKDVANNGSKATISAA